MAERPRRWPAAVGGAIAAAFTLLLLAAVIFVAETVLLGGTTRQWCEESPTFEVGGKVATRCVRERVDTNLVASDVHDIEFFLTFDVPPPSTRFQPEPWPLAESDVEITFTDGEVTVGNARSMSSTYPDEVYEDTR
ncbi:hypothetical protein [Janibacter cremeus]|uniref:DUF4307 domain-containing protein n=1 Tax=Janibacter cremeus TaxID=1285192 RepID=A0A852VT59_9MICO|nr:hypothetical protein [Janibacter cremeus]NYF98610.1 hypothetical protein [Janibacter cremeus]